MEYDHKGMSIILEGADDGVDVIVPAKYEVCDRCRGTGYHDHPAFSNGITSSEWRDDWDEESREMYKRGGYDVQCHECKGRRVVLVPDDQSADIKSLAFYDDWVTTEAASRAEETAERRMGA